MMHILAATDFSARAQRAVRRAAFLAQKVDVELTFVHVVDDDQPARIVELERNEAGRILGEQIGSLSELRGIRCHPYR